MVSKLLFFLQRKRYVLRLSWFSKLGNRPPEKDLSKIDSEKGNARFHFFIQRREKKP